jgi:hypothetical protein
MAELADLLTGATAQHALAHRDITTVFRILHDSSLFTAAQLRCGELRAGLLTTGRAIELAKGFRSVSMRDGLAPLQEAAAARGDSTCRDLARELAMLRSAA